MAAETPSRFRFGEIEIDLATARVRRGAEAVDLEPLTHRLLVYLIEHRDRVVSKEELVDASWQVKLVSDNSLTRQVACLRAALGDDARSPTSIETIHTLGYRFIAAVEEVRTAAPVPPPTARARWIWAAAAALALGAGLAILLALSHWRRPPPSPASPPPMRQLTSDSGHEIFPALSPDGSVLAHSSDRSGSLEVHLRTLSGDGDEVQLTRDGADNAQAT